jgi:hypothetical protein
MAARVKEKALQAKMAELGAGRSWSRQALAKVEGLVRGDDEQALFRVNPVAFASRQGLALGESIDIFLHAAKAGLFAMEWNLVCPTCGDSVQSFRSLSKANSHFHCTVCDLNSEATLDDFIQVSFTISPEVR